MTADYAKLPKIEVGGKLSVSNLHEVRLELVQALRKGFKKRELLVFKTKNGRAKLFFLAGFCQKYVTDYPDMVGELLDRGQWLADKGHDRDMLFVSVHSDDSYEIGVLDQTKRRVYSLPSATRPSRKVRRAAGMH